MSLTRHNTLEAALAMVAAQAGVAFTPIAYNHEAEARETKRLARVLLGAPKGAAICDCCDGYGGFGDDPYSTDDYEPCDACDELGWVA